MTHPINSHGNAINNLHQITAGMPFELVCDTLFDVLSQHPDTDGDLMEDLGRKLERAPQMLARGLPLDYGTKRIIGAEPKRIADMREFEGLV